jgi:2-dehydropantoate 2-reductase
MSRFQLSEIIARSGGETMELRSPQQVAVIGAGAIGGFFAARASLAGHHVTLCVRTPINRLVLEEAGRPEKADVRIATHATEVEPVDWILLATKAQDTAGARPWVRALCRSGTKVVVLQNGIDHAERLGDAISKEAILPAVVNCGAERVAPGHVVHHQASRLTVPAGEMARRLGELFSGTGVQVVETTDFLSESWRKLLANVAVNPLTALTMRRIAVLREPDLKELARGLVTEALAVGRASGAQLGPDDLERVLDAPDRLSPQAGTSMLYDRLAGRPLEHEYITGAVVRAAEQHGITVPLNRAMLALLRASAHDGVPGTA